MQVFTSVMSEHIPKKKDLGTQVLLSPEGSLEGCQSTNISHLPHSDPRGSDNVSSGKQSKHGSYSLRGKM